MSSQPQPRLDASAEPAAVFLREGDRLLPQLLAQGPWDPSHLHGGAVCGVLARAIEGCASPVPMRVARLTVEMTRAVPMAPFVVRAEVTRAGRRIQQIDARIESDGLVLARASALRVRVGALGADAAFPSGEPVPDRPEQPASVLQNVMPFVPGFIRAVDFLRVRLATLCDFASGAGNPLDFMRFTSINPDLSLYVLREPRGEWVGITTRSEIEPDGVGQSHATLFDEEGPVARALVSLLVERRPDRSG